MNQNIFLILSIFSGLIILLSMVTTIFLSILGFYSEKMKVENINQSGIQINRSLTNIDVFAGKKKGIKGSLSMELWGAITELLNGKFQYLPLIIIFIMLHVFWLFLLLYVLDVVKLELAGRLLIMFGILLIPYSFTRHLYKSYKRVGNKGLSDVKLT